MGYSWITKHRIWGILKTEHGVFWNAFYRIWGILNDPLNCAIEYGVFLKIRGAFLRIWGILKSKGSFLKVRGHS